MEIPTGEFYYRLGGQFSRDVILSKCLTDFLNVDVSLSDQLEYSRKNIKLLRDSRAASEKIFLDRAKHVDKLRKVLLLRR